MKNEFQLNNTLACDTCGKYGVIELGDRQLCEECYEKSGSCCLEFGGDDLWESKGEPKEKDASRPADPTP